MRQTIDSSSNTTRERVALWSRRDFFGSLFSTGALVLATQVIPSRAFGGNVAEMSTAAWKPNVFLGLDTDGSVVIIAHRSEMGTGIRTALPMVVADELGADWSRVRVEQALADAKYGSQDTDGSCSIRDFYATMREAGATARLMLENAAAARWNVPAAECSEGPQRYSCGQRSQAPLWRPSYGCSAIAASEEGGPDFQIEGRISLYREGRSLSRSQ
ncbi:MAG: molybdopterin cofactor-binding domain-containing protein [Bryobacteraceae bacterium]